MRRSMAVAGLSACLLVFLGCSTASTQTSAAALPSGSGSTRPATVMTTAQSKTTFLAVVCPAGLTSTVIYKSLTSRPASKIDQATADRVHTLSLTAVGQYTARYQAFTQTDPAWPQNLRADIAVLAAQARTDKDQYQGLAAARTGPDMAQIWNSWPVLPQSGLDAWANTQRVLGLPATGSPGSGC